MTDAPVSGKPVRKKRRILPWLALILIVAVFVAGVVLAPRIMAALPAWIAGGNAPRPVAALPATGTPRTPAPQRAAETPAAAPTAATPVPDMAEFARQLAELQNQVTRLQGEEAADASTTEAVTSMGAQIAHMLNQLNEQQQRLNALEETSPRALLKPMAVLAVARLRQSVEQGSSYAGALGGVQRLVDAQALPEAANKALLTLDAHRAEGVVSALALRDGFAARIEDIIEAEAVPANGSWWDRTLARLENMVSVRPTGNVAGQDAPAIVARAETALNRGDVDKAVTEVEGLSSASAKAAADWLKEARVRQDVLGAVDTLESALLEGAAPKQEGATE
jgi:uroporphyrinogen-III synthase